MSNAPRSSKKPPAAARAASRNPRPPAADQRFSAADIAEPDVGLSSPRTHDAEAPSRSSGRRRRPAARPDADALPPSGSYPSASAARSSSARHERASGSGKRPTRPEASYPGSPRPDDSAPRLTLPSIPAAPHERRPLAQPDGTSETRTHRTLLSGVRTPRSSAGAREEYGQRPLADERDDPDGIRMSSGRLRAAADPRARLGHDQREPRTLARIATAGSALPRGTYASAVPDLAAYRSHKSRVRQARPRVATRALIERARRPWSLARICLTFVAVVMAIVTTYTATGESAQPLMFSQSVAGAGPVTGIPWPVNAITAKVQPETQLKRADLYDNQAQFNQWGGAACSAAALSEVLTAYGVPNATIGRMIDELGPDISPNWGLVTYDGFAKVAALHNLRADVYTDTLLTYPQMQYLTNTLGVPVIVNVRISYGYYHFFSGGHFMVMTYGDAQGVRLVDSSLYYVQYLPMDVFRSMFTGRTAVIVSKDMQYTLPT